MQFSDITGHEAIIRHLQNAIQRRKVSHAYILDGPEKAGKMMLAEAFAQALQCEEQGVCGCGHCRSCRQAEGHNHPDILYVVHEKKSISVSDVRDQINATVDIRPYNLTSRYKIYIVDEAEKMGIEAQNALLKTLEEPPAYVVFLLLTTNADAFLPTVRSRCVQLSLHPVQDDKIRALLMRRYQVVDYQADICTAFAQGNVGKAILLAASGEFYDLREETIRLLCDARSLELSDIMPRIREILAFNDPDNFYDFALFWYRDVLLYKTTGQEERLLYRDRKEKIVEQAAEISYEGLNKIFEALETARRRAAANVNAGMALEMLLLVIKEQR